MNWNIIEGKWKEFAGMAREKWGQLTDDEVQETQGNREKMIGLLQAKYGHTQEAAANEIDAWADKIKDQVTK